MRYTILTFIFGLMVCFVAQAQFSENFDNGIPNSWTKTYLLNGLPNNNPSEVPQWESIPTSFQSLVCQGDNAAYVGRQNIGKDNTTQSWLISPAILIPSNGRLQFSSAQTLATDFGTVYQVRVSTLGTSIDSFESPILSLSENELSPANICQTHGINPIIDLSSYTGEYIHIAFIKIDTQPTAGTNSDRWILDDIHVYSECNSPSEINVEATNNSANLSWEANGTNNWEIIIVEGENSPSDNIVDFTTTSNQLLISDLETNTHYTVYIRANCDGNNSSWTEGYTFLTKNCDGQMCSYRFILNDSFGDGWDGNTLSVFQDGIEVANLTLYDGNTSDLEVLLCHNKNLSIFWNDDGDYHEEIGFSVMDSYNQIIIEKPIGQGEPGTEIFNGTINCTAPTCPNITNLEIISFNDTEVTLEWTELGNASSWEIIIQPIGIGTPSNTTPIISYTNTFTIQNLDPFTQYEVFVRSICDNETSAWVGGNSFTTMLCHPDNQCLYNFTMTSLNTSGWGDNIMHIIQNNQTIHVLSLENNDSQTVQLPLCSNIPFSIFWVDQGWIPGIVGLEVTDSNNSIIFTKPFGQGVRGTTIFELENTCQPPSCPNPQNILFSNVTQNSLTISWTEMGNANLWEYVLIPSNSTLTPQIPFTQTITNTIEINNLNPSTTYTFYLRAVCDIQDKSNVITTSHSTTAIPPIIVDTSQYSVPELVQNVLFNSECVTIENINWSTGTNFNSVNGIGYFEKGDSSFGFTHGIILSTGDVMKVPGPKTDDNSYGSFLWEGDQDLLSLLPNDLSNSQLFNATVLEFDFIAISDHMSFDFIFASDEYGEYQCFFSDIFAFLLTDTQTGQTTNLAVVPNTNIPISVTTIRDSLYNTSCDSQNAQYFDTFYDGTSYASLSAPINFSGSVVPLTASSDIIPNRKYHIKLAIADFDDYIRDSAVFLLGGSFNIGEVQLGEDLLISNNKALCYGQNHTISAQIPNNELLHINWYHNNNLIEGEYSSSLNISQPGEYTITLQLENSECSISDSIVIEYYPNINEFILNPTDINSCDSSNFDLSENILTILSNVDNVQEYNISFHLSESDAIDNSNPIDNINAFAGEHNQIIWIRITQNSNPCYVVKSFRLSLNTKSLAQTSFNYNQSSYCISEADPYIIFSQDFTHGGNFSIEPNLSGFDPTNGTIDLAQAQTGTYTITYHIADTDCVVGNSSNFTLTITNDCLIPRGISPNDDGLNDVFDLSSISINQLIIYNRYGKEVYSKYNYTNQWKGQDNDGKSLPDGTYFYVIEKNNGEKITGWVYVNKQH